MRLLTTFLAALLAAFAPAAAQTFPERDRAAVVDAASVIPDADEAELAADILAWNRETGHQFVVATVPSLQGRSIQDYSNSLFRHWALGRAGVNDGVLLLLAPTERAVRIEVGYGLEGVLTDALTSVIIREAITPGLRKGDIVEALGGGARRIMAEVSAEAAAAAPDGKAAALAAGAPPVADPPFPWGFFLFLIVAIFGPIILIFRARRKKRLQPRSWDERRHATVTRRGEPRIGTATGTDALAALSARTESSYSDWSSGSDSSSSSSWDSASSSSSDSGFDSGGGSSGGGGSDSNY